MGKEKNIIESWKVNAGNWITLLNENGIESRKLATNKAILDVLLYNKPSSVLDIGCGEGWLSNKLGEEGIRVTGVDAVEELIWQAKQKSNGDFFVASYEEIATGKFLFPGKFDAIVINFALLAKESTEKLLLSLPGLLSSSGKLFIQTLHPLTRKEKGDYKTGWKQGSWEGLGEQFTQPYEWYFRTLEDWVDLLERSGFTQLEKTDVLHPVSAKPLAIIFECGVKRVPV